MEKKIKFINHIWVIGKYNNYDVIGRTLTITQRNPKNKTLSKKNYISSVSEFGIAKLIPFDEVKDIRNFNFKYNPIQVNESPEEIEFQIQEIIKNQ